MFVTLIKSIVLPRKLLVFFRDTFKFELLRTK